MVNIVYDINKILDGTCSGDFLVFGVHVLIKNSLTFNMLKFVV